MLDRGLQVALSAEVVAEEQVGLEILRLGADDCLEKIGRLIELAVLEPQHRDGEIRRNERGRDREDPPILGFALFSLVPRQVRARQRVTDGDIAGIAVERALELDDLRGEQRVVRFLAGQRGELDANPLRVRRERERLLIRLSGAVHIAPGQ